MDTRRTNHPIRNTKEDITYRSGITRDDRGICNQSKEDADFDRRNEKWDCEGAEQDDV